MLPAGIVLVGGGAKLSHLVKCAKEELGLPAQIGYPIDIEGLIDEVNSPSFAAAVGLIKWSKELHQKTPSFRKIEGSYGKILGKIKEFFKNLIP